MTGFDILRRMTLKVQISVLAVILVSPLFGVHIHHEADSQGNRSVIHSYYFESHDSHHPPVDSPPESLPEHLGSAGLSEDLGSWDSGLVSTPEGRSTDHFFHLTFALLFIDTVPFGLSWDLNPPSLKVSRPATRPHLARTAFRFSSLSCLLESFLPPPSLS